ncbi:uncharacterized protein HMPREF1541_01600 [Cyphellophora europaea CBS 101466]|uniref:Cytokinesis regulator n=1 Tax=Cyphellophora europaea (strain CBS 101466) TaxID=1220924 RepID=W2S1J3_CYPE1|nr:uncharacterized protein HMPREF1541_01600 [Cyphellophora europaea CBS 101466]ETN42445.1 hypothetical protein HMPREF1541_01600 [Cyphellophora europaea CBS 101466]
MESLQLKQRDPDEMEIENWDDGDFDNLDDIPFRSASTATSVQSHPQSTAHRESASSRMSIRSDSNQGDENWDVLVDDQAPIKDAIALAKSKGIPLPSNVPRSALEGGTIRRLNGKAIKKAIADDWSEDLDLPGTDGPLKLAKHEDRDLSDSLRQISAAFRSSPKTPDADLEKTIKSPKSRITATPISLDAFRDDDDDDFDNIPTIRVSKQRSPNKPTLITPTSLGPTAVQETIEEGLELPSDGQLRLSTRKPNPRTPQTADEFDFEWGEGSLGTRNAGRGKGGRSARSSSASALSPSVSSAFTAESEDEGLDGLVLPDGPIKFEEKLKKRQAEQELESEEAPKKQRPKSVPQAPTDDFFEGLEIGDGQVFSNAKLSLNRNVKHKAQRPASPPKRTTTTLSFTSSKKEGLSRLPRFNQPSHERTRSSLEPVSESGAAVTRFQRPGSRLGLHSAQSSVSAIPAPSTPTPSTPSRRAVRTVDSRPEMRHDGPTTTNAQLLRAKRSMPAMRTAPSPTKSDRYVRPPSRAEAGSRLHISYDRPDSRGENRAKQPVFLPAGASSGQSQHASLKHASSKGHFRRADSDGSGETMSAAQRSLFRIANLGRPETPRSRTGFSATELAAQAKKQVTKPSRRRNYGEGNELDIFDDLPTSATLESKFTKAPVGRGAPRSLRLKLGLGISQSNASTSTITSLRTNNETPVPITPLSPPRQDFPTTQTTMAHVNVPRFARDTAASRNAREQRAISTTFQNMHGEPLKPISANYQLNAYPHTSAQRPQTTGTVTHGSIRKKKNAQQKPHLIKPMGPDQHREKSEKGMRYNPSLYRWEGNENVLAPFDIPPPDFYARTGSPVSASMSERERKAHGSPVTNNSKTNVALISNVGTTAGVQVVGGMVFDPSQMRWLKVKEDGPSANHSQDNLGGGVEVEEEEDVFAGLDDLKEEGSEWDLKSQSHRGSAAGMAPQEYGVGMVTAGSAPMGLNRKASAESQGSGSGSDGEFGFGGMAPVAEEFDVGPEFVRRQRAEEDRWRRKVDRWLRSDEQDDDGSTGWRWNVRRLGWAGGET